MSLPKIANKPRIWAIFFALWAAILWKLSDGPLHVPAGDMFDIPHIDKVVHFGYFFGGAGLLCAWLFLINPNQPKWDRILLVVMLTMLVIGRVDEWHQSWVPERTGNDISDYTSDVLGALVGFIVFKRMHGILLEKKN